MAWLYKLHGRTILETPASVRYGRVFPDIPGDHVS